MSYLSAPVTLLHEIFGLPLERAMLIVGAAVVQVIDVYILSHRVCEIEE